MNVPVDLRRSPWPMNSCPTPPEPGESVQVCHYKVEARLCTCCKDAQVRYFVRNIEGVALSMAKDWRRLCHVLNWYPMPGLEPGQPIPRTAPKAPNKPLPRTVVVDHGPREDVPLPLFNPEHA